VATAFYIAVSAVLIFNPNCTDELEGGYGNIKDSIEMYPSNLLEWSEKMVAINRSGSPSKTLLSVRQTNTFEATT
jgi:hypothetical protein